jgi:NitT/TauT family transport system substrate-binding protein
MARVRRRGHRPLYSLRMRDAGFVESTPQKIIAEGTDWRFLNELKRELKA